MGFPQGILKSNRLSNKDQQAFTHPNKNIFMAGSKIDRVLP